MCFIAAPTVGDGAGQDPSAQAIPAKINYLQNSAFTECTSHPRLPDYWGPWNIILNYVKGWSFDNFGIDDGTAGPLPGVRTLKMTYPAKDKLAPPPGNDGFYFGVSHSPLPGKITGTKTLSVYAKAAKDDSVLQFGHPGFGVKKEFKIGLEWKRVEFTGTEKDYIDNLFFVLPNPDTTAWIAAPQLEDGSAASAYRPAPGEGDTAAIPQPKLEDQPLATSIRTGKAPVIDGKLDDQCWTTAAKLDKFLLLQSLAKPSAATTAFICHDDKALYIAVRCEEPAMDKLREKWTERDGGVYEDDSIEFFLSPTSSAETYYHFGVNTLNTHWDAQNLGQKAWDPEWTSAIAKGKDEWILEVAVPFTSLPLAQVDDVWRLTIGRNRYNGGTEPETSSWMGTKFHDRPRFGRLAGITAKDVELYRWMVSDVQLAKQDDGSFTISGSVVMRPGGTSDVRVSAEFAGTTAGGKLEAPLADGPAPTAFQISGITLQPELSAYQIELIFRTADGRVLSRLPMTLAPSDSDISAGAALDAYFEFDYYTNDKEARLRVQWVPRQKAAIACRLLDSSGKEIPACALKTNFDKPGSKDLAMPLSSLSDGEYRLVATAAVEGGGTFNASDRLIKLPPSKTEVRVNRFIRGLQVDGKAFFPTWLPSSPLRTSDWSFENLKNAGFNSISAPIGIGLPIAEISAKGVSPELEKKIRAQLDRLQAQGIRILFAIAWDLTGWFEQREVLKGDISKLAEVYARVVETFKDHPAIIGWYWTDEPGRSDWEDKFGYKERDMTAMHDAVRKADPYRPTYVNYNHFWKTEPYGGMACTDILCHDDYILSGPLFDLERLVFNVRMINNQTVGRRPAFIWISGSYGPPEVLRFSRPYEIRVHAWLQMVYGTRGIGYFANPHPNPEAWKEMKLFNTEACYLMENAVGRPDSKLVRISTHNNRIHYAIWTSGGNAYLFAVSTADKPLPMNLDVGKILGRSVGNANELFEKNDGAVLNGGIFTTTFPPFERRAYVFDIK